MNPNLSGQQFEQGTLFGDPQLTEPMDRWKASLQNQENKPSFYLHMTHDPNFEINPHFPMTQMNSVKGAALYMTQRPDYWRSSYTNDRPYTAVIKTQGLKYGVDYDQPGHFSGEDILLRPGVKKAQVVRVAPSRIFQHSDEAGPWGVSRRRDMDGRGGWSRTQASGAVLPRANPAPRHQKLFHLPPSREDLRARGLTNYGDEIA